MTTVAVGNRRLLKLAGILDTARRYNQSLFAYSCGTPACALGHWAAANPRRWRLGFPEPPGLRSVLLRHPFRAARVEFAMSDRDVTLMFGTGGCGCAKTGKQASRYIRRFVQSRSAK